MRTRNRLLWLLLLLTALIPLSAQDLSDARDLLRRAGERLDTAVATFDREGILAAADLYRQTLTVNPRYGDAEVGLAEAAIWLGDYAGAQAALDRAEALRYPGNRADLLRARLAILTGDLATAQTIYDRILSDEPYNGEVLVARTILSLARGTSPVVYRRLQDLEQRYPRNLQLLVALIELSMRNENDDISRRYIELAIRYHNDNAVVQTIAARYALSTGDAAGAAAYARNAVQLAPGYDAAWMLLAQAVEHLGRGDEARTHYEQLLRIDPNNHRAWYARSILLAREGEIDQAATGLHRALDIRPDYEIAQIALENIVTDATALDDPQREDLARRYLRLGSDLENRYLHRSAERIYRRGLQIDPFNVQLRIALAELYLYRNMRARYLQELEVLRSIGFEGYEISDRIDAYRALMRDSLGVEWNIDQFTAQRPRTSIALVYRQDGATVEPEAAKHLARYLASLLNTSQNAVVTELYEYPGDRTRAIAYARGINADRVVFLDCTLEDRRIVLTVEMVDTLSAQSLVHRVIPQTGRERLDRAVREASSTILARIPVRGTVLARRDDRVLVSFGTVDGVEAGDRAEFRAARSGQIFGTSEVSRTDDLLSEFVYQPNGPDLLGRGDEVLYLGPPPEEDQQAEEASGEANSPSQVTVNLPLVQSLFSVPD